MRDTAERRNQILAVLCERRHEKINCLAEEFNVSERTIRRDVEIISLHAPIYTETGIYGGVRVMDGYYLNRTYLNEAQEELLKILLDSHDNEKSIYISEENAIEIKNLIKRFSRPKKESSKNEKRKRINT